MHDKITDRVTQPTPEEVREARERVGFTQGKAAELVSAAKKAGYKTWGAYELSVDNPNHRDIPLASWELFLLLTGQHPSIRVVREAVPSTGESGE